MNIIELKHGEGWIVKLKSKGPDGTVKESRYWYILYYAPGKVKQTRVNSKCTEYADAYKLLIKLRGQAEDGQLPLASQKIFRFEHMEALLLANYSAKNRAPRLNKDGSVNYSGSAAMKEF